MQTVIETPSYLDAAKKSGMSADEMAAIVDLLARQPDAGDLIVGSGGCRKLRFRRPGRGKSGGYRVITFFSGPDIPVFLLTVFAKGAKATLTGAEVKALSGLTKTLVARYRALPRAKE